MTTTAAKWSERVRDWRASGRPAEEFASGFNFKASTLLYWASRLKTEAKAEATPTLARVVRTLRTSSTQPTESSAPPEFEIVLGAARIVVRRGFDAELLRDVVAALIGSTR